MAIRKDVKEAALEIEFAKEAAKLFSKEPSISTYGSLDPGSYLAIRWGLDDYGVMVIKLDSDHIATNYTGLIVAQN